MSFETSDHQALAEDVAAMMGEMVETLAELIRIPSVSAPSFDPAPVKRSAEKVAEQFTQVGMSTQLLELEGAHPAVYGEIPGPPGSPTVLLYAHHDVQPPGPEEDWGSAPFEPRIAENRIYGRGASDDKAGIIMHLGSVRALGNPPPIGIKLLVEGEEEVGSTHLETFLERYQEKLAAEVVVIGDSGNWRIGQPALTNSLRGLVAITVKVKVADRPSHSGVFGGVFPDALMVLSHLLSSLHDRWGNITIPGLIHEESPGLGMTEEELRRFMGVRAGVETIGSGNITSRLWTRPALSILAIDAPLVAEAINQLVPEASAKISLRIPPGQDPDEALNALRTHLLENVPWGAQLTVAAVEKGEAFRLRTTGRAYDAWRKGMEVAWGKQPIEMGIGGSIPFVAAFSEQLPEATILLTGAGDPTSSIHAPNENQHLGELEKCILAQTIALRELAHS